MLQTCFMLLLFDETINQCNHDYSVDINICASGNICNQQFQSAVTRSPIVFTVADLNSF